MLTLNRRILKPDLQILKKKVESLNTTISDDIIELIAQNITSNVRDIESALTKLIAYAELVNKKLTKEIASSSLLMFFQILNTQMSHLILYRKGLLNTSTCLI